MLQCAAHWLSTSEQNVDLSPMALRSRLHVSVATSLSAVAAIGDVLREVAGRPELTRFDVMGVFIWAGALVSQPRPRSD